MNTGKIILTSIIETMVSKNHMAQFVHIEGDKVRLFVDKIINYTPHRFSRLRGSKRITIGSKVLDIRGNVYNVWENPDKIDKLIKQN